MTKLPLLSYLRAKITLSWFEFLVGNILQNFVSTLHGLRML